MIRIFREFLPAMAAGFFLAVFFVANQANAASVRMELTGVFGGSTGGVSSAQLSGTLTGNYNTATGIFSFDPGTVMMLFDLNPNPNNDIYTWSVTDWVIGAGSTSASAYECIEGTFGAQVGAHVCANTIDQTDFIIDTTTDYSSIPGTRTLGINDVINGPQQQLSDLAASMTQFNEPGLDLVMETQSWTDNGGAEGVQFVFSTVVPVPAAIWLFGSALGLLGWVKRKAKKGSNRFSCQ